MENADMTGVRIRIAKAQSTITPTFLETTNNIIGNNTGRKIVPGYYDGTAKLGNYHDDIKLCRWFYTFDPIAGTVTNRMADMAITTIRNRRKTKLNTEAVDDATMAYFDAVIRRLRPFLKLVALEYLLHGLVVPEYTLNKIRGDLLSEKLGRKRYSIPDGIWVRNPENLILRRRPIGIERQVWLKIPKEDIDLIMNKGVRTDGTQDKEAYTFLITNFPEYVAAIRNGQTKFLLDTARPIMRKITSYEDYPAPFLRNALSALQHKAYLKTMDRAIASRAIEAIRLIKTGDKDFPADDDDITALESKVTSSNSAGERVFNLFTNHTVSIEWIFPPLEALLNEAKYSEPNADIFLALGFPRILTTGETLRSNSSDSKIASLGPKATLDDLREAILAWLEGLYQELAERNGFDRVPEPYFSPIATTDYTALVQFAIQAQQAGAISKDTVAQLYGSDFETEADQIESEIERAVPSPTELQVQKDQEFQMQTMQKNQEFQQQTTQQQMDFQSKESDKQLKNQQQKKPANNNGG